ncbi:MAG: hypothetical protein HKM07_08175 [Chlamydiae bacterium]|nr:hypothetical protein [Chlamydiota bacterium]
MEKINYKQELNYICRLLPTHSFRRSLAKHLIYLNEEIIKCKEKDEPTLVMELAYDCIDQTIEMLDEIKKIKVVMNGGKN